MHNKKTASAKAETKSSSKSKSDIVRTESVSPSGIEIVNFSAEPALGVPIPEVDADRPNASESEHAEGSASMDFVSTPERRTIHKKTDR